MAHWRGRFCRRALSFNCVVVLGPHAAWKHARLEPPRSARQLPPPRRLCRARLVYWQGAEMPPLPYRLPKRFSPFWGPHVATLTRCNALDASAPHLDHSTIWPNRHLEGGSRRQQASSLNTAKKVFSLEKIMAVKNCRAASGGRGFARAWLFHFGIRTNARPPWGGRSVEEDLTSCLASTLTRGGQALRAGFLAGPRPRTTGEAGGVQHAPCTSSSCLLSEKFGV